MSFAIGRLAIDDPDAFPESVGEAVARVGGTPVPGGRAGLSVSATLSSFTADADADTTADRQRVRRQLRSIINNLPMRLQGLYVAWDQDDEQDGWYVPGTATFDIAGQGALQSSFWRFTGVELALVGRPRTHRRGVQAYIRDRRVATEARDYLRRIYSTDFAALSPLSLLWLPSDATDIAVETIVSQALVGPRTGYGSSSMQAVRNSTDLAGVDFEQQAVAANRGDVVVYDRRGTLTGPTTGPDATWEEVYGIDWPWESPSGDVPVLDNSLCRVRFDATSGVAGFKMDVWTGSAWAEQGKFLIRRIGDSSGFCDDLVWADLVEWTPDRAVVRAVMRLSTDVYSRERVFITLQRGWSGPRIEVYPAPVAALTPAGAAVRFYAVAAPVTDGDAIVKIDAAAAGAITATGGSGSANFPGTNVGASTFTGENSAAFIRAGSSWVINLATLQVATGVIAASDTSAYGSARNGASIGAAAGVGYVSAHFSISAGVADQQLEAESITLGSGTSSSADGAASNGNAATTTRTTDANAHVTRATWPNSVLGKFRVFVRVKTTASTLSVYAKTTATTGVTKTSTSTSYVWLDLGDVIADGSTLEIHLWSSGAATKSLDRIVGVLLEDRTAASATYRGMRDLGQMALYDTRASQVVVAR